MCAMMPMLRQRSSGKVRATAKYLSKVEPLRARGLDEGFPEKERLLLARRRAFTLGDAPRQDHRRLLCSLAGMPSAPCPRPRRYRMLRAMRRLLLALLLA